MLKSTRDWLERGYKSNCQMCRCGNSTLWRCGDVAYSTLSRCGYVVDPHLKCGGPQIIRIYPRMNVNLHYSGTQYMCIYSHLKCGNPHCSTIHPHCSTLHPHSNCGDVVDPHCIHIVRVKVHIASTLHPHSNCGDVVDPHCIHIVRVKVHIASTSQAIWTHSSTSDH